MWDLLVVTCMRKHVLGIKTARDENDLMKLKPIPHHFKTHHDCDSDLLRVRRIDRVLQDKRGGDWKKILAQSKVKWISILNTMAPMSHSALRLFYKIVYILTWLSLAGLSLVPHYFVYTVCVYFLF